METRSDGLNKMADQFDYINDLMFYLTDFILHTYIDVDLYTCLDIKTENIMWIDELFEAFQHETNLYNFAMCYLCMAGLKKSS